MAEVKRPMWGGNEKLDPWVLFVLSVDHWPISLLHYLFHVYRWGVRFIFLFFFKNRFGVWTSKLFSLGDCVVIDHWPAVGLYPAKSSNIYGCRTTYNVAIMEMWRCHVFSKHAAMVTKHAAMVTMLWFKFVEVFIIFLISFVCHFLFSVFFFFLIKYPIKHVKNLTMLFQTFSSQKIVQYEAVLLKKWQNLVFISNLRLTD